MTALNLPTAIKISQTKSDDIIHTFDSECQKRWTQWVSKVNKKDLKQGLTDYETDVLGNSDTTKREVVYINQKISQRNPARSAFPVMINPDWRTVRGLELKGLVRIHEYVGVKLWSPKGEPIAPKAVTFYLTFQGVILLQKFGNVRDFQTKRPDQIDMEELLHFQPVSDDKFKGIVKRDQLDIDRTISRLMGK